MKPTIRIIILACCFRLFPCSDIVSAQVIGVNDTLDIADTLVWDSIYSQKIMNFVGKKIIIQTKIRWDEGNMYNWNTMEYYDTIIVGRLRTIFENYDLYYHPLSVVLSEPGNIFMKSDSIKICMNNDIQEQYFFGEQLMYRDSIDYFVYGTINFRDFFHVTEENLKDSVFIKQCNNVAYWSQTFDFTAINMEPAEAIEVTPVKIDQPLTSPEIKVFPNPVTEFTKLIAANYSGEKISIVISTIQGVTVLNSTMAGELNIGHNITVPGVYFYIITRDGEFVTSGKLVKE